MERNNPEVLHELVLRCEIDAKDAIYDAEASDRPRLLLLLAGNQLVTLDTAAINVPGAWSACDCPMDLLSRDEWAHLFNYAEYTEGGRRIERFTDPVVLYRGAPAEFRDAGRGHQS